VSHDAIIRAVHAQDEFGGCGPRDWMQAWREIRAMGWKKDMTKPYVCEHRVARGKDPIRYGHFIDPVTGDSVEGLMACYRVAAERYMEHLRGYGRTETA
jgi:hypothetical protein